MVTKRVKKYEKMMTHQIPSHLAFRTLGQNKKNKARDKSNKNIKKIIQKDDCVIQGLA